MNDLDKILKEATIIELKKLDYLNMGMFARDKHNQGIITYLHDANILDKPAINEVSLAIIYNQAEKDYEYLTREQNHIVSVSYSIPSRELFAYAIKSNQFSEERLSKILSEKGLNQFLNDNYNEQKIAKLFEKLSNRLLHPEPVS